MGKNITEAAKQSSRTYDMLEEMVRLKAQEYIQDILVYGRGVRLVYCKLER